MSERIATPVATTEAVIVRMRALDAVVIAVIVPNAVPTVPTNGCKATKRNGISGNRCSGGQEYAAPAAATAALTCANCTTSSRWSFRKLRTTATPLVKMTDNSVRIVRAKPR